MYAARCTEDGVTYAAVDFAALPPAELARKRHLLECPDCGRPAFFRRASRSGRAACFGARPHAETCELAAQAYEADDDGRGEDQDRLLNPGNRIVLDLDYGAANEPVVQEADGLPPNRRRRGRFAGEGPRPNARMHRRLGPLLRMLIDTPAFGESDQVIEIAGRPDVRARDLFVPVLDANARHGNQFHAYWGVIATAQRDANGTLWLNAGGRRALSFCLGQLHIGGFLRRYGIADEQDIVGAHILVLGVPTVSQNGKLYCDLTANEHFTIRLAR